jgi:hypothetical protein
MTHQFHDILLHGFRDPLLRQVNEPQSPGDVSLDQGLGLGI